MQPVSSVINTMILELNFHFQLEGDFYLQLGFFNTGKKFKEVLYKLNIYYI